MHYFQNSQVYLSTIAEWSSSQRSLYWMISQFILYNFVGSSELLLFVFKQGSTSKVELEDGDKEVGPLTM